MSPTCAPRATSLGRAVVDGPAETASTLEARMPFPDRLLADDEEVVEHLHPHWITLVVPATLFVLICAMFGVGIAVLPSGAHQRTEHTYLLWAVLAVTAVLLTWLVVAPLIRWRSSHYVITTHRVLIRRGVINHVGRDITLSRIADVSYRQTIWDRIVRAGSLTIESAGEHGQETLHNIPRANEVQQTLNRLIEDDSVRRNRGQWPGGGYGAPGSYGGPGGYGGPGSYGGPGGYGGPGAYSGP
jgi:membrane protein YdbS with pleckstrin-like domain